MVDRHQSSPSQSSRRARAATLASWGLGVALAGAAAAGPALAEAKVQRQLRDRFGVDDRFAVDLDLGGLELRGISRTLPDNRGRISAERIRIRPSLDGFVIEIDGLDGVLSRPAAARPTTSASSSAPASTSQPAASPPPSDPIARLLTRVRGVPIEVVSHGHVAVELGDGLRVVARDPGIELPGDGRLLGRGQFELGFARAQTETWVRAAHATLEFSGTDEHPRDLQVRGSVDLDDEAPALAIAGRVTRTHASLTLHEAEGGGASIAVDRNVEPGRDRVTIDADALPLALLDPVAELFGRRFADAIGERDGRVSFDDARISGAVELSHGAGLTRARFDGVELSKLTIDSDLLAPEPVALDDLHVDGELARERTPSGPRSFAQLTLDHAGVALQLSGQLDHAGFEFDVELPSTPCQAVLDAMPGAPAVLAGTELRGELDARFGLRLDFAALAEARERYLGEDAEALELESFDAPGELRFSLPYLEQCEVVRLGPGLDVDGLHGPYRHRFETGSGAEKRRVLAVGDADYVDIKSIPKVALAFVILEDARFWAHDGFDREQIERAFWFNLLERRVSRGASTITQQAARSLWLGIDRSIARKLAEAMLTAELERELGKRRILEIYLNIIELGPEIHGVAEAARYHFGKEPRELSLIEALHLASMAPAPVTYSRRFADGHIDTKWRDHLRRQVRRLRIRHLISAEKANEAAKVRLRLRRHPELLERSREAENR